LITVVQKSTMVLDVTTPLYAPKVLQRCVGDEADATTVKGELVLLFLGCEAKPPYGPYQHTATSFLDLICRALIVCRTTALKVILKVYSVSQGNFPAPRDYEECHGVILPGSFNSAYDEEPWVLQLSRVIQDELVAKRRPTLGVCFGHQLYAHSFAEGAATKCPAGPQAGRKVSTLTEAGRQCLPELETLQLFYTHGDMLERLPPQGLSLGGNDQVPIQAAVYYSMDSSSQQQQQSQPMAITFQAHPEFGSKGGVEGTLYPIVKLMEERGDLTPNQAQRALDDAKLELETVERQSIGAMVAAGRLLGWFPKE
jgi:GMP synthase-like glutamine amidotransferase